MPIMSKCTVRIPGHAEPLKLEACEASWMEQLFMCNGGIAFRDTRHTAPVYEGALRDVVTKHLHDDEDVFLTFCGSKVFGRIMTYSLRTKDIEYPSTLHVWRTIAQKLRVGPWAITETEKP